MFPTDPGTEQHLIELVEKAAENMGSINQHLNEEKDQQYSQLLMRKLATRCEKRPWLMRFSLTIYRLERQFAERKLARYREAQSIHVSRQKERVEMLRFAEVYGQKVDATGRAWCEKICARYQIPSHVAAYLVWGMMICPRQQKIYFGYWDLFFGAAMMFPLVIPLSLAFVIGASTGPLEVKTVALVLNVAQIIICFTFAKSLSFDLYRVGSNYFKPNGWKYSLPL